MRIIIALLAILPLVACDSPGQRDGVRVVEIDAPTAAAAAQPHLARTPDGVPILSWQEAGEKGHSLKYSLLHGKVWSDAVTIASGDRWFVNWADFPSVVAIDENLWAAHWLVKKPGGTYAYDVAMSLSNDAGASWSQPITPHADNTATEHGFVTVFPWNGSAGAVWLDGRAMESNEMSDHGSGQGTMSLRFARVSADGSIDESTIIDDMTCDCCATDVAMGTTGPILAYRDRNDDEVRDIAVSRLEQDGWSQPTIIGQDNWKISGCPVNGPAIDAEDDHVVVAWFTAADNEPRIRFARSADGGKSFSPAVDINTDQAMGRVDVVLVGESAWVSWITTKDDGTVIRLQSMDKNNTPGPRRDITAISASRSSGFPQLIQTPEGSMLLAWTDADDTLRLRTMLIELPQS